MYTYNLFTLLRSVKLQNRSACQSCPLRDSPGWFIGGFYNTFTNHNFKQPLSFPTNIEFHPSGNIRFNNSRFFLSEIIVGEIIVKSPYEWCLCASRRRVRVPHAVLRCTRARPQRGCSCAIDPRNLCKYAQTAHNL